MLEQGCRVVGRFESCLVEGADGLDMMARSVVEVGGDAYGGAVGEFGSAIGF
ncbi:MAG: hypothetical protein HC860_17020 [Alkalinema sp. RU_4_3]|nr:hypothetical protein [Alkalinema sp. RU_4_3]